jgi:hypothetical protein
MVMVVIDRRSMLTGAAGLILAGTVGAAAQETPV